MIGAHTNASGGFNQFVDGRIDEVRVTRGPLDVKRLLDDPRGLDCNGNGIPDVCDILEGVEGDCDGDGTPDACDPDCDGDGESDLCEIQSGDEGDCDGDGVLDSCEIAAGAPDCDGNGVPDACQLAGEDCNGNGIPDACDIADGLLGDCNGNGIPDACELGEPLVYRIDDGGAEFGIRGAGTHMVWLTNYRVEQGAGLIEALEMSFVFLPDNASVTVGVWSDPDGDGDPTDAQLLTSLAIPAAPLGEFRTIDIPDTYVGPNGTSFFIGGYRAVTDSDFPAPLDASGEEILDRCWVIGHEGPIDLNALADGALEFALVEDALPFSGKWLSRCLATTTTFDCNENGVLDGCEIADGTVEDSDGSGVPDECEDCNANGVLDSLDIADGTSLDCNADLVPDECQIGGSDCDGDGVLDECQIAQDAGLDCNGNGRLDACDLAAGSSEDLDGTGIPDECEDCNANGVLDSLDIADGTSLDCNADLVPDECQLGDPPLDVEYLHDDGSREGNYGVLGVSELVWLNRFETEAGGETIGTIGVIWGHWLMGYELTFLSLIGFVALSGIVVNDSLILVQFFNGERGRGTPLREALVIAGRQRLRPIMLTTITTVLGLTPLMLERSFQAAFLIPMAISIAFGLLGATILILLLLPALLVIIDDLRRLLVRLWHGGVDPAAARASEPAFED